MHDRQIFPLVGRGEQHGDAEAIGKGEQFLFTVPRVYAVHAGGKTLLNDMSAVAGCHDHNISCMSFHRALQRCFER